MKWSFQPHVIDIILMHVAPSLSTMHISLRGVVLVEFHTLCSSIERLYLLGTTKLTPESEELQLLHYVTSCLLSLKKHL